MSTFYFYVLCLTIYSFIGWALETVLCSIDAKKFVNRGFLNGPFCPIYGFGAILILLVLQPFAGNLLLLFLAGILLTSVLEYVTGYLLERIFSMKWWDYSGRFMNIKGRVCLANALAFGVLAVVLTWYIHPFVSFWLHKIPAAVLFWAAWFLLIYFIVDTVLSSKAAFALKSSLAKMHNALVELEERRQAYAEAVATALEYRKMKATELLEEKGQAYKEALLESLEQAKRQAAETLEAAKGQYESLLARPRRLQRRLLAAFPTLTSVKHGVSLQRLRERIREQLPGKSESKEDKENKEKSLK